MVTTAAATAASRTAVPPLMVMRWSVQQPEQSVPLLWWLFSTVAGLGAVWYAVCDSQCGSLCSSGQLRLVQWPCRKSVGAAMNNAVDGHEYSCGQAVNGAAVVP